MDPNYRPCRGTVTVSDPNGNSEDDLMDTDCPHRAAFIVTFLNDDYGSARSYDQDLCLEHAFAAEQDSKFFESMIEIADPKRPRKFVSDNEDYLLPIYIGVFAAGRCYGGPEEGGWWYDTGELIATYIEWSEDDARATADRLRLLFPRTRARNSVNGGEDYEVDISLDPPQDYPQEVPHYS